MSFIQCLTSFLRAENMGEQINLSVDHMRQGLRNGEFILHYQPKYDLFLNRITGLEALIRWYHNGRLISPIHFLPAAEESGWINELGDWILNSAICQAVSWRQAGHKVTVAINVSSSQIQDDVQVADFITKLDRIMKETAALPTDIELEVTEGIIISPAGMAWVEAIKARGIALAIDDFGTGYSSLAYLKNIGAHTLKIDKSFVDNAPASLSNCLLLEAMINIGHSFGMLVVAEGVEEEEQMDFLRFAGCDILQGYLFSKPLHVKEVEALFANCTNPFCNDNERGR